MCVYHSKGGLGKSVDNTNTDKGWYTTKAGTPQRQGWYTTKAQTTSASMTSFMVGSSNTSIGFDDAQHLWSTCAHASSLCNLVSWSNVGRVRKRASSQAPACTCSPASTVGTQVSAGSDVPRRAELAESALASRSPIH